MSGLRGAVADGVGDGAPASPSVRNRRPPAGGASLSHDLLKRTGAADRDCAALDIQIIGRKAHPPTGLNGRVGFQNEAVRESTCLAERLSFPTMQAVPIEPQERPHPARRQIDGGPYQQVLGGPQQHRQNRRRAHDREKFKHNVRALQPAGRRMKQHFKLGFRKTRM